MRGLELSKEYYLEYGKEMLKRDFSQYQDRIAVGLVGHGSECFGFDDEISRDHDFDCGFCLWLTEEDERLFGFKLLRAYDKLPQQFRGIKLQKRSLFGTSNKGVHTIGEFYSRYTGTAGAPTDWKQWLYTPSEYFAEAVNGEVFSDPLGKFTAIRNEIKNGCPEDVWLKKIAARAIAMAQSGQYNYKRCISHGETAAAKLCLARFAEHCANMLFLLNRTHAPYYKWLLRAAAALPILGNSTAALSSLLCDKNMSQSETETLIEQLCSDVAAELISQNLCADLGDYLEPYAYKINEKIKNPEIRGLHIMQY